MPAEKGIPKPEALARRVDANNYDSKKRGGSIHVEAGKHRLKGFDFLG